MYYQRCDFRVHFLLVIVKLCYLVESERKQNNLSFGTCNKRKEPTLILNFKYLQRSNQYKQISKVWRNIEQEMYAKNGYVGYLW